MKPKKKPDLQTISLFLILALLTFVFVLVARVVLFAPTIPVIESATR